jgi:hypothetical protein
VDLVRVIVDNYSTHKTPIIHRWLLHTHHPLAFHPDVFFLDKQVEPGPQR